MSSNKIKCELCGQEFKSNRSIGPHINAKHKITTKEYYDQFFKKGNEDKCPICGKSTKFTGLSNGYKKYCSSACSLKDPEHWERIRKTNLERYGSTCSLHGKEVQEKVKKTNLERYGTEYPTQSEEIKKKTKQTNLERYGVERPLQNRDILEKVRATNIEKYGVENVFASEEIKDKIKQTNIKKYGVENPAQSEEIKNQIKQTNLERYGVENVFASEEIKERVRQTNLQKFGVEHPSQSKKIQEKKRQTFLERYEVPVPAQNPDVQKKMKETTLERYGVENVFSSPEIQEKIKQINLVNYGVENPFASDEIKERIKQTNLDRYGVENPTYKHMTNYEDWLNLESFLTEHNQEFTIIELCNYFNTSYNNTRYKIRNMGVERYIKEFYSLSLPEQIFAQELDKLNVEYELHNRKVIYPLELDFYLSNCKLAIEISPTFTHQYTGEDLNNENLYGIKDPEYHYNKFKLCKEQGIELITIFDWTDQSKVINFIKSKYQPIKVIEDIETTVRIVKDLNDIHIDFLERNHILGSINNSKTTEVVELHYDNEVIGLAVFEQKKNYTELRRLAFESGYRVQGGASKLIKAFTREHSELKKLITFSDNDLGTGNVYDKLGFQILEENTGTLIWYNEQYDKKIPNLSLVKQGTDRLLKNFPGYEYVGQGADLPTNQEIIQQYGFVPVYDCGYTKWALTL